MYQSDSALSNHTPPTSIIGACGQLGVQIKLPDVLSLGKEQRELS
jgi:hypothetical protein